MFVQFFFRVLVLRVRFETILLVYNDFQCVKIQTDANPCLQLFHCGGIWPAAPCQQCGWQGVVCQGVRVGVYGVVDRETGYEWVLCGYFLGNLAGECGVCIHHQQGVFKFVNGGIFMDNLLVLLVNYLFEHIGLHVRIDDAFRLFDDEVGVFDAEIVHLLLQDGDFRFVQLLSDQGQCEGRTFVGEFLLIVQYLCVGEDS